MEEDSSDDGGGFGDIGIFALILPLLAMAGAF
jgi:hypothetical protein